MYREVKTMELFSYAVLLLILTAKLCSADEGKDKALNFGYYNNLLNQEIRQWN